MQRNILITAAFAALTFVATVAPSHAGLDVNYLEGSREDVRAHCVGDDAVLSEREDYSMCIRALGATLTCNDDGECIQTGYDLVPVTGSIGAPRSVGSQPFDHGHAPSYFIEFPQ